MNRQAGNGVLLKAHRGNKKAVDHVVSAQDDFHFAIDRRVHNSGHDIVFVGLNLMSSSIWASERFRSAERKRSDAQIELLIRFSRTNRTSVSTVHTISSVLFR